MLSLADDGITVIGGVPLTVGAIQQGLVATSKSTSLNITVSFKATNQEVATPILNAVLDATVQYSNAEVSAVANNLIIGEYATTAIYSGQSKTLFLVIFVLLGGIVGVGIGLTTDLVGGRILFANDVARIGLPSYHFVVNEQDKELSDHSEINVNKDKAILALQNSVESNFSGKLLKMVGFAAVNQLESNDLLIKLSAESYAAHGLKTLVVDLDLTNPTIHTTFGVENDVNLLTIVENGVTNENIVKQVSENLFVLPSKKSIYPARVLKNENFLKLIEEAKHEFDYILLKLSPASVDETSQLAVAFTDCVIINTAVNKTKKTELINYINTLYGVEYDKLFINVFETKKPFNLLKMFSTKKSRQV